MSVNTAFDAYKKSENEYVPGIESAHGRIKILFDTMISNLDKLKETHPKTVIDKRLLANERHGSR